MREFKQSGFTFIGTDMSLETCRDEGYGMMGYKNHGTKDARYIFIAISPYSVNVKEIIWGWTEISLDDIKEKYEQHGKGLENYCCRGMIESDNPIDILNAIDDINRYCGWDIEYDHYSHPRSFFKDVKELLKEREDS